jgi:hypothetical protein
MRVWRVCIISLCLIYHFSMSGCFSFFFSNSILLFLYLFPPTFSLSLPLPLCLFFCPFVLSVKVTSSVSFSNCVWCVVCVCRFSTCECFTFLYSISILLLTGHCSISVLCVSSSISILCSDVSVSQLCVFSLAFYLCFTFRVGSLSDYVSLLPPSIFVLPFELVALCRIYVWAPCLISRLGSLSDCRWPPSLSP